MSIEVTWPEIALRLILTIIAGSLIGFNRGEHGHPAGLRTTILVCLAASISMIQVNLLLGMSGKAPSSFVVMDLMRLPLGILSGMGFIGAGAILRKDNLITGVTTAATLWFVTVMGLCFGGGQLLLGIVALALGFAVLAGLKAYEARWHQERIGTLTIVGRGSLPDETKIRKCITDAGAKLIAWSDLTCRKQEDYYEQTCCVSWNIQSSDPHQPLFLKTVLEIQDIHEVMWKI